MEKENEIRLEKLNNLTNMGIEAYTSTTLREKNISEIRENIGKSYWIAGKVVSLRDHGKSTFADLKDESNQIQIYFKSDILEKKYEILNHLDIGDYLEVHGEIFVTHVGETTVKVDDFKILTKSLLPLPDEWYGFKDTDLRYRKRFVDLLSNPQVKKNIETHSKIISCLRSFMQKEGFIEVETPILQPIPGGAAAKPFITHYNILDADFYLRVSPELYLKRLIVGGFEKIFEVGRCFRNEGLSHMHNPEFTMFEFYWAYKDYEFLMSFTEKMLSETIENIKGSFEIEYQGGKIDFSPSYPRIVLSDLIKKDTGIDITKFNEFESLKNEIQNKEIKLDYSEIKVWTKLVDELYKKVSRPKLIQPTFIIDHPIELSPLAKEKDDNPKLTQRFQLVCGGGMEIVNAYSELNDPIDQEKRIAEQLKMRKAGWNESERLDGNFIEALKYGMPPTAGWGMGIDRFTMLLTDQYSIKEVIAFPALKPKNN